MHHAKSKKATYIAPVLTLLIALPSCSPTAVVGGVASTVTSTVGAVGETVASVGTTAGKAAGTAAKTASKVASTGASGAANAARSVGAAASAPAASTPVVPTTAAAAGSVASSGSAPASEASQTNNARADAIGAGISQAIVASMLFCAKFEKDEYRIDCFANQLEQVSETTPDDAEFGQARSILADTAAKLSNVVKTRSSKTLGPVTLSLSSGQGRTSSRAITAVATEELPAALSEAELVLEEAQTLLLRASEQSERRKLVYADMAQAVGSTKVLLRSA